MPVFLTSLHVTPMADGINWRLNKVFSYRSNLLHLATNGVIDVMPGFVTDFGSVPQILQAFVSATGRAGPAFVLHDWAYWSKIVDRDTADNILHEAMDALGCPMAQIVEVYNAVHLFGEAAWQKNADLRANGYDRVAPMADNPPFAAAV